MILSAETIILKNKKEYRGKVINHNINSITIIVEGQEMIIPKNKIFKVVYISDEKKKELETDPNVLIENKKIELEKNEELKRIKEEEEKLKEEIRIQQEQEDKFKKETIEKNNPRKQIPNENEEIEEKEQKQPESDEEVERALTLHFLKKFE